MELNDPKIDPISQYSVRTQKCRENCLTTIVHHFLCHKNRRFEEWKNLYKPQSSSCFIFQGDASLSNLPSQGGEGNGRVWVSWWIFTQMAPTQSTTFKPGQSRFYIVVPLPPAKNLLQLQDKLDKVLLTFQYSIYIQFCILKFVEMWKDESFTDVTIATEKKIFQVENLFWLKHWRIFQAHKLILSACSPYFRHLFSNSSVQHPILILKVGLRILLNYKRWYY